MKVYKLALFTALAAAIQIPISLNVFRDPERPHFSTLEESLWPIDLNPYINQVVVRISSSGDVIKYLRSHGLNIWAKNPSERTVDVQGHESDIKNMLAHFEISDANYIIHDLAQTVLESYPEKLKQGSFQTFAESSFDEVTAAAEDSIHAAAEVFFKLYRPLLSIDAWLKLLEETYPDVVTTEVIGKTYEERDFKVLHVLIPDSDIPHDEKRTIVITGGVHAREWISVSSTLYTIYEMLNVYENSPERWKELAKLDFLFIPVLNPDGYEYSWNSDRLWRKNRQQVEGGDGARCMGIDIDHSFDYHWTQSSDGVCGEEYSGQAPFEAYELKIWDEYLNSTNVNHNIWGYIDLHSYSQEILYPYAYSCNETPRDEENLIELAYGITKAIRLTSGKSYSVLPACVDRDLDLIPDLGSGSALDFMYHHRAYWAYQVKLRDSGAHGFLLPDKYIQPVGEEIAAGIRFFSRFILSEDR
ncbi:CIC11C00000001276 [Sungouiella intermedia]|uniref:Inactive metallocarboxypeptidase ECM14 n=1 Tax=Sungouiella intermedia TaxID=45354 RepID=A0A1L0DDQ2_9ASCO|nr:CIC11C00000001276 [[Candida] intermedia]